MCLSYINSLKWYRYNRTIQACYINQVSSQEIKTRTVQHSEARCLARTLHFSWPTCTWHKINEFDSTLALPWGRRFALEHQFYGVQAVCVHHHHPYYAKPVPCQYRSTLSSIAPFGLVTMARVIILFCCKVLPLHELGIMCWGTPPNPPTTPWILDIKLCCHDQMQACFRRLDVAILYLPLLRSTCHDPLPLFFLWANRNTSEPLTYSVLH